MKIAIGLTQVNKFSINMFYFMELSGCKDIDGYHKFIPYFH